MKWMPALIVGSIAILSGQAFADSCWVVTDLKGKAAFADDKYAITDDKISNTTFWVNNIAHRLP